MQKPVSFRATALVVLSLSTIGASKSPAAAAHETSELQMAKDIQEKLNPHHATGADVIDPLLFRYRYQQHAIDTDRLVYYQYEARRHAHVVMLDDLSVEACTATPGDENRTALTLSVDDTTLRTMNVSAGSIIVGRAGNGCYTWTEGGGVTLWQAKLQERVVDHPRVSRAATPGMTALHLITTRAAFPECFEYSQVEFYHGLSSELEGARNKRQQSLADKRAVTPPDIFASTETVIADAKAASARKRAAERLLAHPNSTSTDGHGTAINPTSQGHRQTGRGLSHWCYLGLYRRMSIPAELEGTDCSETYEPCANTCNSLSDGSCDDGGPGAETSDCPFATDCADCGARLSKCMDTCDHASSGACDDGGPGAEYSRCEIGTDCTDCGSRVGQSALSPGPLGNDCFLRDGAEWFVRPGNTYKLKWWMNGITQRVKIEIWEDDGIGDDFCIEIRAFASTNNGYNEYTFTMPSVSSFSAACRGDGFVLQTNPEYYIWIETDDNGCHRGRWPPNSGPMMLLEDTTASGPLLNLNASFSWMKEIVLFNSSAPSPPTDESGSVSQPNQVIENAPGVGDYGGFCTCPDGQVYEVGGYGNGCAQLACEGGQRSPGCSREVSGPWSGRRVVCGAHPGSSMTATAGVELRCRDCGVFSTASTHMLIRTSDTNPFEEAWVWGNVSITALIDFMARGWLELTYESQVFPLVSRLCVPPMCWGGSFAGIQVNMGVAFGLNAQVAADFRAQLTLTYIEGYTLSGSVQSHGVRRSDGEFDMTVIKVGFDEPQRMSSPQPPALAVEVEASATAWIIPEIFIGLFGGVDWGLITVSAEASVMITKKLGARVGFQFQAAVSTTDGWSVGLDALQSSDQTECALLGGLQNQLDGFDFDNVTFSCGSDGCSYPPYCNGFCRTSHDTQLDISLLGELTVMMKLNASVGFGSWRSDPFDFTRYLNTSGRLQIERVPLLNWHLHVTSVCGNLTETVSSPPISPPPPALPSPSPPPPRPSPPPPVLPPSSPVPCPSTCIYYGSNCDSWAGYGYSCSMLSSQFSCDCSGCACPTVPPAPPALPPPSSPPPDVCPSTCSIAATMGSSFEPSPPTPPALNTCDYWVANGYSCSALSSQYGCDCSGCICNALPPSPYPPEPSPPPPPPPSPPIQCPSTCYSQTCDDWAASGYTCSVLADQYGCDCSGCSCPPSPSPPPSWPAGTPVLCAESCNYASDGICDDGGPGSQYVDCSQGTDCTDCGPRQAPVPLAGPGTFFNATSNQCEIDCDGGGRRLEAAEDELVCISMPARTLHAGAGAEPLTSSEVVSGFLAQHPELASRPLGDIDHATLAKHFEELSAQLFGQPALA